MPSPHRGARHRRRRPGRPRPPVAPGGLDIDEGLQLLLAGVRDYAIVRLDPSGRVATWSAGAEQINGYRPDDIIGRPFSSFYTPEDIAAGQPTRQLATAGLEGRVEAEGWRVRRDGSLFYANVVITALIDEGGHGAASPRSPGTSPSAATRTSASGPPPANWPWPTATCTTKPSSWPRPTTRPRRPGAPRSLRPSTGSGRSSDSKRPSSTTSTRA